MAKNTGKASEAGGREERTDTAAFLFKKLIMAGNLSDDKIFEQVKAKFELDDDKRRYVSWYRSALKKEGKNPPAPKGGKVKAAKVEKTPVKKGGKKAAAAKKTGAAKKPRAKKAPAAEPAAEGAGAEG